MCKGCAELLNLVSCVVFSFYILTLTRLKLVSYILEKFLTKRSLFSMKSSIVSNPDSSSIFIT